MPRHRLPPLNSLPSFEAAARHLSFSRAADELRVTHGAVSRAVRNLEHHLGVRLMMRASRSVRLTPIGASFAAEIRDVLDHLAAATSAATGQSSGIVSASTIDSFAARWLMPRLFRFRQAHGDIDVRVAMSERLVDFVADEIDIAIRCGGGQYPGLSAELLMTEDHFPVCSPKLLKGRHPLRTPANLGRHTLLHDASPSIGPYGCAALESVTSILTGVRHFYHQITRSKLPSGVRASCSDAAPWSPTTLPQAGSCGRSSSACLPALPITWSIHPVP
jgi:LysR family transcriptional regulator, glycine cleavage system transcriptional activator